MAISISSSEKLDLINNLGTMISAGIPILETVDSLAEDARGNQKKILLTLRADLVQGKTVSFSFSKFPAAFDSVTINLLKAAEEAGTLDTTLSDLTHTIRKDIEFSDKVKAALTYPILVIFVFFLVLVVILTFVVPRIAKIFSQLRVTIPLPTKIFIGVSYILTTYYPYVITIFLGLAAFSYFLYKTKKRFFLYVITSFPLVSGLAADIDLTRFCRTFALLLSSGIPITEALDLSQQVIAKKRIVQAVAKSRELVNAGQKFSEGLRRARGIIPSIMVRIVDVGEKSGGLDTSLQQLSDYFEYRVTNSLKTLTALLEPILLVVIGLLVGGMMLAVIAPIYGLISQISAGR